jgi:hypothetical protein
VLGPGGFVGGQKAGSPMKRLPFPDSLERAGFRPLLLLPQLMNIVAVAVAVNAGHEQRAGEWQ